MVSSYEFILYFFLLLSKFSTLFIYVKLLSHVFYIVVLCDIITISGKKIFLN